MTKKISKMTKEELELLSYNDIAELFLQENPAKTTLEIFNKIGEFLELSKKELENKIGEFYTSLTNDQRFIMLEDGKWDLTTKHKSKNLSLEEDIEDYEEIEEYDDPIIEEESEENYLDNDETEDTSDITEEYKNLVIVEEEELNED